MSDIYLVVGLAATFSAVALIGTRVGFSYAERRKALRLLETQVGHVSTNLRDQQTAGSFSSRVFHPLLERVGHLGTNLVKGERRSRIDRKLALAGSPHNWDAQKVVAAKVLGALVGAGLILLAMGGFKSNTLLPLLLFTGVGFFAPDGILAHRAEARQKVIQRALPDTMDLLTISVEAGLGFDAALVQVMENVPGPLSQEIGRLLHEVRLGVSRSDAFRHLSDRTNVEELNSFILAIVQAESFGVSISRVLRAQAKDQRTKRRQRAEEKAMKIPVKILFPLIFCVLPALFVVVIGPGAIRIVENIFGIAP